MRRMVAEMKATTTLITMTLSRMLPRSSPRRLVLKDDLRVDRRRDRRREEGAAAARRGRVGRRLADRHPDADGVQGLVVREEDRERPAAINAGRGHRAGA